MRSGLLARKSIEVEQHSRTELGFAVQASAVAVGDLYTVASGELGPPSMCVWAINQALRALGRMVLFDDTLTVVGGQNEYTLPAGVANVGKIEVGDPTLADPGWVDLGPHFYETNEYTTGLGMIRFRTGFLPDTGHDGEKFRLWHRSHHPMLVADNDDVYPGINLERLKWEAKGHLLVKKIEFAGQLAPDDPTVQLTNKATAEANAAEEHEFLDIAPRPTLGPGDWL